MIDDLVSIVIPTYNRAHYITDALESVRAQNYRPLEVIIVDDGSTDDTEAVVQSWVNTHATSGLKIVLKEQNNAGAPAARNYGLRISTGNWVKFLDSDDVLHPACIETQVKVSQALDEHEIVFGDLGVIHDYGAQQPKEYTSEYYDPPVPGTGSFEYLIYHVVNTPTPLHCRHFLDEVGGFKEGIEKGQEYDLHLRLALSGVSFVYRRGVVAYKRVAETKESISSTNSPLKNPEAHIFIQDNRYALAREYYDGDLPECIQRTIARGYWMVGRQLTRAGHAERARYCFTRSRDLATDETGHIIGPRPYQWAARSVGPIAAERMLSIIKRCMGR